MISLYGRLKNWTVGSYIMDDEVGQMKDDAIPISYFALQRYAVSYHRPDTFKQRCLSFNAA